MVVDRTHMDIPRTHLLAEHIKGRHHRHHTRHLGLTHRATRHLQDTEDKQEVMARPTVNSSRNTISKDLEHLAHQLVDTVPRVVLITHKASKDTEVATINHSTANNLTTGSSNQDSQVTAATLRHQTTNMVSSSLGAIANTHHLLPEVHSTASQARTVLLVAMVANKVMEDSRSRLHRTINLVSTRATTRSKEDTVRNRAVTGSSSSREATASLRTLSGDDVAFHEESLLLVRC